MLAIYIFPFALILLFNILLLRAFFISKKRCQQYKLRTDPNRILRDYNSFASNIENVENNLIELKEHTTHPGTTRFSPSIVSDVPSVMSFQKQSSRRRSSTTNRMHSSTNKSVSNRGRALTLTLFGVVAIFFICHFPAAIAKIIYVLFPEIEFEDKSAFASICLDLSNFLIMVNSSINFLLYIVFGPSKFRQEFTLLFFKVFRCCSKYYFLKKKSKNQQVNISFYEPKSKKCSISNSEFNYNFTSSVSQNFNNNISKTANSEIGESSSPKGSNKFLHPNGQPSLVEEKNL